MHTSRELLLLLLAIAAVFATANYFTLLNPVIDPYELTERITAVNGYIAVSFATIMTPLLRGNTGTGAKAGLFLRLHYALAAVGLSLVTIHPVSVAIRDASLQIFIPITATWTFFWANAGRPALFLFYIAIIALAFRRSMKKHWRYIHGLMYIVLFLAIVHANLLGTDFDNPAMRLLFDLLFASSISAFVIRRFQESKTIGSGI